MEWISAISFLGILSILLATTLVVANSRLKVYEDPRIDVVADMLPGANCGACGLPGCRAFAEAVIDGEIQPSTCSVGGEQTADAVADYLGIDPGSAVRKVARLHCAGGRDVALQAAIYLGHASCRAAAAVFGGPKACAYGCLGLADCMEVCSFGAIEMGKTGLPVVDAALCTGCGDCVEVCPKALFELLPVNRHLLVQCKSLLAGEGILSLCQVACTACGRCVADSPEGLMKMQNNLPCIDPEKAFLETDIATLRCPTRAIVWVEEQQFQDKTMVRI